MEEVTFKNTMELEYGFKFKDNFEFVLFIVMNIIASPGIWLIGLIAWGWIGFFGSIILFILLYWSWKLYGGHKGKLSFSPAFRFGSKSYRFDNEKNKKNYQTEDNQDKTT